MKKVGKEKGEIHIPEICTIALVVIVAVALIYLISVFRERNRLQEEQCNQIISAIGAIKETVLITDIKSNWRMIGSDYSSEFKVSFHKPSDRYSEPPHIAKIVNGQIVEVDDKPVKEVVFFVDPPDKAPVSFPGQ